MSEEWSLDIDAAMAANPNLAGSITQIVDKGYLEDFLLGNDDFTAVMHLDTTSRILSVEDPQFIYFLRTISWSKFPREIGFVLADEIPSKYDFALSFAGADREVASAINDELRNREMEVFYDKNEQHRILAEDVEDYLRPIYQTDAQFVIALLGPEYPKKIWTKFESEQFKQRFNDGAVIPVWFTTAEPGMFDESSRVGGFRFDPKGDINGQVYELCELVCQKIAETRGVRLL